MKNLGSAPNAAEDGGCPDERDAPHFFLRLCSIVLLLGICACSTSEPILPPKDGYPAIRFKQPVSVRDHSINIITFPTGSTFVADHQFPNGVDGPIYCGTVLVNDVLSTVQACFALDGNTTIILNAGCAAPSALGCRVRREIPAGSFEAFQMPL
jgi:hypothetical protein